jgi:hypothetical protein
MRVFNPDSAVLEIPFSERYEEAADTVRVVRFGPASKALTFNIQSVSEMATGTELPTSAFRLTDAGADGDHRLVQLRFRGEAFTKVFREEVQPENFLERLKGGLLKVQEQTTEAYLTRATVASVVKVYNQLHQTLRGTHAPLFAALTGRTTLAISAEVPEILTDNKEPTLVTLYVKPRPILKG